MRPEILVKRILLTITFFSFGLALSAALFLSFIPEDLPQNNLALLLEDVTVLSTQEQTNIELPARLKIPSVNVDAHVESLGLTFDGAIDVPKGPNEVAWFNLGPRPGENGSAVITGHYDWKNNMSAVFENLHKLGKGDKLSVEDERGVSVTFVVRESRIYSKDEAAPDVFNSSDGKAHLNLVTCAGVWNETEKTHSERLVVFTDKE